MLFEIRKKKKKKEKERDFLQLRFITFILLEKRFPIMIMTMGLNLTSR